MKLNLFLLAQLLPVIRKVSGGSYLSKTGFKRTRNTLVCNVRVPQSSVATQLRCGKNVMTVVVANCLQSVSVKELLKSVDIWRRYGHKFGGTFFLLGPRCIYIYKLLLYCLRFRKPIRPAVTLTATEHSSNTVW